MLTEGGAYAFKRMQVGATAIGDGNSMTPLTVNGGSYALLTAQVVGISGDTITWEGTIDEENWIALPALNVATRTISTTATADGIYRLVVTSLVAVRARVSTYSSGTIYVYGLLTAAGEPGFLAEAVSDHGELDGLSDNDHPQYVPALDTRANILASSPALRTMALATDTLEMFYWTGSAWYVAPLELDSENTTPDMGAYNSDGLGVSDRQGYYSNVITDKVLHHMVIGHSDRTESGSFRVSSGELQVYLSSAWSTIVTGFRFQQDSTSQVGELEYRPSGYSNYYGVQNGNGNDLDYNGLPLVQQYQASMGVYAAKIVVDGGTF